MVRCPRCQTWNNDKNKFCKNCGFQLPEPENYCPECDKTYSSLSTKFCPECGTKLISRSQHEENIKKRQEELRKEKQLKNQLIEKISLKLNNEILIMFKRKYNLFYLSKPEIIEYILDNYSKYEIDLLFDELENNVIEDKNKNEKMEENLRKQELFNELCDKLNGTSLLILKKEFSIQNSSKTDIINFLIYNYSEDQINNILKEIKNKALFYENLSKHQLTLLSNEFSVEENDLISYLINNFSQDEVALKCDNLILKEMLYNDIKKFNRHDLDLFSREFSLSGDDLILYLADNYSRDEVLLKRDELIDKERLSNEIRDFGPVLGLFSREFSLSGDDLILYLVDNYSRDEVLLKRDELIDKEKLSKKIRSFGPVLDLFSEVYSLYGDELVSYLVNNFSKKEIMLQKDQLVNRRRIYTMIDGFTDHDLDLFSEEFYLSGDELVSYLADNFTNKKLISKRKQLRDKEFEEYCTNLGDEIYLLCYELSINEYNKKIIVKNLRNNFSINQLKDKLENIYQQDWFDIFYSKKDLKQIYLLGKYFQLVKFSEKDLFEYLRENCSNEDLAKAIIYMQKELNNPKSSVNSIDFNQIDFDKYNICVNCNNEVYKDYVRCPSCKSKNLMVVNSKYY